jgi:NADH-quinone oxidoreductase subunit F
MTATATATERTAVDDLLGPAPVRGPDDGHAAVFGFHAAQELRHLLLPALQAVQSAVGWISAGALNYVCERLAVPPADAYGVATFYALLATEERPPTVVHVCDDVPCRLAGAEGVIGRLERDVAAESVPTGDVMWIRSPCLGQCDRAPAAFVQRAGDDDATLAPTSAGVIAAAFAADPAIAAGTAPAAVPASAPQTSGDRSELRLLRRVGEVVPGDLDSYRSAGGYQALQAAVAMGGDAVISEIEASRLRGRGGAAFPAGVKWRAVAQADGDRYVICNADESEPGTFKDRVLLEGNPFAVVEAMTIAGFAVGPRYGYVYVRGEYPLSALLLEKSIAEARREGLLGADVMGAGFDFDLEVRRGAGAYICGEETALFNSIEGYRGEPRQKPPFPTDGGLFGRPTLVNNVETLANVIDIVLEGGQAFTTRGTPESTGTKLFCLSGHVAVPGVYEVEFGATVRDLLELAGGVVGELRAVLVGGAAGSFVGPDQWEAPLTFEGSRAGGFSLGSGVVVAMNSSSDLGDVTRRIAAFFRDESCGQCVPCRVGTVRQEEALHRLTVAPSNDAAAEVRLLDEIDRVMRDASICGLGHTAGSAVQSAIRLGLIGAGS